MKKFLVSTFALLVTVGFARAENVHIHRRESGDQGDAVRSGGSIGSPSRGIGTGRSTGISGGGPNRAEGIHPGRTRIVPRAQHLEHATPPNSAIVRNNAVVHDIQRQERVRIEPNHYYWRHVGRTRYVHYYHGGNHWYGFYHGPRFYWTRYYDGYWWWHDAFYDRWVYWWDGRWVWLSPTGLAYVYVNDDYVPLTVAPVEAPVAQQTPAVPETYNGTVDSPDKRRRVEVFGSRGEAFLYDITGQSPVFMTYLGSSVERVRFSGGNGSEPLEILVDFRDGHFAFFNADGFPVENSAKVQPTPAPSNAVRPPTPAAPPDDFEPPPPSEEE